LVSDNVEERFEPNIYIQVILSLNDEPK
jgi:hypothetical protein